MLSASRRADTLLGCDSLKVITPLYRAHYKQEHPKQLLQCIVKWNWKFPIKDWCHIHIPLTFYSHFLYYTSVTLLSFLWTLQLLCPERQQPWRQYWVFIGFHYTIMKSTNTKSCTLLFRTSFDILLFQH